jgi:uncharacterized protein YdhG (YjbR/CyaY superfamily)
MKITPIKTVDDYIAGAPVAVQKRLQQIRQIIREVAPEAQEKLSYGMPYYGYKGRLVYFAYAKNHIGLYVMPPIIKEHKKELDDYVTAKATVQFALDKDLPIPLIKKLVSAGVKLNEAKAKK